ncbi:FGGY-family carbohydrate kinase [Teredinibacter franksiae]|uniref:FGGY-family carbohydrate kinase n=1 Tax=Teredinibacter franksiae TaxID=2761453 RepID=UPI0016252C43|nr:FGGY family carbohydrate kinase [Teredinibacter franksiae]
MTTQANVRCSAVFDIGKTNIKLSLLDSTSGELIASALTENHVLETGEYRSANTDSIWCWFKHQIKQWAGEFAIERIGVTTHGATIACVGKEGLVLPVLDYEYGAIDEIRHEYNAQRPPFTETLSPALPFGLNLGAQIFWLQTKFPEAFAQTQQLLFYPQYWCYLLTGRSVSEMTSLGCHTDLWNPNTKGYSSLVEAQGWSKLFPPISATGERLGFILPALVEELGLPDSCEVYNGIHDSNASLVPHLFRQEAPFAVVSSGTWIIIAGIGSPTSCLDEDKDMLANVNAFAEPTSCIRFMGGREWQVLAGTEDASEADFIALHQRGIFALPAFSEQGGPYRNKKGTIVGIETQELSESEKTALATLYLALMTDHCLEFLNQNSTVIIEGAFARNTWLMQILASLRSKHKILFSRDATGTTAGTACLFDQANAKNWPYELFSAEATPVFQSFISSYKQAWLSLLSR